MTISKPGRIAVLCLLLAFNLFIFRGTLMASKPPDRIGLKAKMDIKIKWKKEGDKKVPVELILGKKSFPFVKKDGKYGVNIKVKELMNHSPEFKHTLQLAVAEVALRKITQLVGKDRQQAQQIVDHFKNFSKGKSTTTAKSSGKCTADTMSSAYNQVLNSDAFIFPMKPLPFADDSEEASADDEEEEEDASWIKIFAGILFAIVVIIAPVVAAVWLAAQALTFAAVFTAFLGSIGAVTIAGNIASLFNIVDMVIQGKPLIDWEGM